MNGREGAQGGRDRKGRRGVDTVSSCVAKDASRVSYSVRAEAQRFGGGALLAVSPATTLTGRSIPGRDRRPLRADWLQLLLPWQ